MLKLLHRVLWNLAVSTCGDWCKLSFSLQVIKQRKGNSWRFLYWVYSFAALDSYEHTQSPPGHLAAWSGSQPREEKLQPTEQALNSLLHFKPSEMQARCQCPCNTLRQEETWQRLHAAAVSFLLVVLQLGSTLSVLGKCHPRSKSQRCSGAPVTTGGQPSEKAQLQLEQVWTLNNITNDGACSRNQSDGTRSTKVTWAQQEQKYCQHFSWLFPQTKAGTKKKPKPAKSEWKGFNRVFPHLYELKCWGFHYELMTGLHYSFLCAFCH